MHALTNSTIRSRISRRPARVWVHLRKGGAVAPAQDVQTGMYKMLLLSREEVEEDEVNRVTTFDTGVSLSVPPDSVAVISAAPTLLSHGYMLANGIQLVIARGSIKVSLYKFREGPDLELPYEGIQVLVIPSPPVVFHKKVTRKVAEPFSSFPAVGDPPQTHLANLTSRGLSSTLS